MPKRLGAETSRAETARCRHIWGAIHFGAETSCCRNVYGLKCFGAVLLPYSFNHHCTSIQKEHGGEAKQDVKLCNTCWLLPIHRTSPLRSRRHSHKEILEFFFSCPPCLNHQQKRKRTPVNWFCLLFSLFFISV